MFCKRLYREDVKKIFLSGTTRPSALIFGMKHHLVDLYQVCSNYIPEAKKVPRPWGQMLYIGLYKENLKKLQGLEP